MMTYECTSAKNIFDSTPIGILLTKVSGEIVNKNKSLITMIGYLSLGEEKRICKNRF